MINWIKNREIKTLTTFGIGGSAFLSADIYTISEMQDAIVYCNKNNLPYFIIGKGSNCLFDDRGINAVLLVNKIDFIKEEAGVFHVGAGYSFSRLGSLTARKGWSGLEFASGIPGSVGGAVFMNAGANGTDTCKSLVSVDYVDNNGELYTLPKEELKFSYRHSSFHHKKGAIVGATFRLSSSFEARKKQLEIIEYRTRTQPYSDKSAGCIFRNPEGGHAGALIEKAGLKGMSVGGAEVSTLHGNFIINREGAKAEDVLRLAEMVEKKIKELDGVQLEREVRFIPYDWSGHE